MSFQDNQKQQPFLSHLKELKNRLLISLFFFVLSSVLSYSFYDYIYDFLIKPFTFLEGFQKSSFHVKNLFDAFTIKLKVSIWFGFFFSFPVMLFHFLRFIFPALKIKEKKILIIVLLVSFVLTTFAIYYGYFNIIPLALPFLVSNSFIPENMNVWLEYNNIFYILKFLIISIVIFQLPIILEFLLYLNVVTRKVLLKQSRIIIIAIFVMSAIVTPPDIISQIFIAVPLIFMFFLTILIAKIFNWGNNKNV